MDQAGPTGVIGTNKPDAQETVRCMMEDMEVGRCFNPGYTDPATVDRRWRIGVEVRFGGMIG